ncbi:hypothetical protein RvY_15276 [Ramazzottius varieornatus]|uniref:Reverse transcriptase domain-containing protein n=1 Tax=Ramazzottius varieornatus TaxID=947166 RepID=A0A1D1VVY3_RAMVA|nr:hypothetical protein RvY_15276 [Ramazzottius varieornatus]
MSTTTDGAFVDAVYLDYEKHSIVLITSLWWLHYVNHLKGRLQVTLVDGSRSDQVPVTSGVPQGSLLGPLLFLCLINSEVGCLSPGTRILIFADDIMLYRTILGPDDDVAFQQDLQKVHQWSSKRKTPEAPDYLLGTAIIPRKNTVKYLGVFLNHKLN